MIDEVAAVHTFHLLNWAGALAAALLIEETCCG